MNSIKFIISLFLITVFVMSICVVSASDNDTDIVLENDNAELPDELGSAESDVVGKTINTPGSKFSDIRAKIDSASDGDVIKLTGTTYVSDDELSISVNKKITIQGASNNVVLDGKSIDHIIQSGSKLVTLKNIRFINANIAFNVGDGGCKLINCTFENNYDGVWALGLSKTMKVTVDNCIFKDNTDYGLLLQNTKATVSGSTFVNNRNTALFISSSEVNINSSTFNANKGNFGGAIYNSGNINVSNSLFINNNADSGSALYADYDSVTVLEKNVFVNNNAHDNVANIGFLDSNTILKNNIIKNSLSAEGDAQITITPTGNYYGDLVEVKVTNPKNNLPFANRKVTVIAYKDDYFRQEFQATTNANGIAYLAPVEGVGDYDFIAVADLGSFKAVSSAHNISYYKLNAVIKADNLITTYNSAKTFTAQLINKNTNKAAAGVKLYVFISSDKGYKSYDLITDASGRISISTSSLAAGTWNVDVSAGYDSENIDVSAIKSAIKIGKAPTKVKAPKVKAKSKKSKYFKVTVKAYNKPVSKLKIKVKVYTGKKSKTYTLKTDKRGVAKYNVKKMKLKKGNHKVVISSGNANYKVSAKSKITIK